MTRTPKTDIKVRNHGSIVLLHPLTKAAEAWFDEYIGKDNGYQPQWPSVLVEPRYAGAIIEGAIGAGLKVTL